MDQEELDRVNRIAASEVNKWGTIQNRRKRMNEKVEKLAELHTDWFLKTVRPILIEWFIHGHKHGMQERDKITYNTDNVFANVLRKKGE